MKKFLIFAMSIGLMLAGCDLFPSFTINDILGEWDFSDRTIKGKAATDIHLSILDENTFDLGWDTSENDYLIACDGAMKNNVFTGTYDAWDGKLVGDSQIVDDANIKITFTLNDDKLTATFEGSGLLDGVTLTEDVKQVY
ncbi:MAG: hypothetical protein AAGU26_07900 [bacterium]|jgi:hypothetical protein